jgi:hypothetical protein
LTQTQFDGFASRFDCLDFICECGSSGCTESVSRTVTKEETVCSGATHFALKPVHEAKGIESAVAHHDRFVVSEKHLSETRGRLRDRPARIAARSGRSKKNRP